MRAIVLAGGFGTRLRSVTGEDTPKPMVKGWFKPGHREVPWLRIVIDKLKAQNITDITLALHYKPDAFKDYFGDKLKYKIESEPLGTGGAIKNCIQESNEPILVLNGDTMAEIDFWDMRKCYKPPLTIARTPDGLSAGIYILEPSIFDNFTGLFSMERDVIPQTKRYFYGIPWFVDIGTPEGYESAQS